MMSISASPRPWQTFCPEPAYGPNPFQARHVDVLSLFLHALRQAADKPAIHYFDRTIHFSELNKLSTRFAVALRRLGVRQGDRVALYMQNIPQFTICALGIWKAGAIGVTINPMNRARELQLLLGDSGASVLVTQKGLYHEVARDVLGEFPNVVPVVTSAREFQSRNDERVISSEDDIECVGVLELADILAEVPEDELVQSLLIKAEPDDPAMLVYTSGTTGQPKGAIVTHSNLAVDAELFREWMGLEDGDALVGLAPLFHITGLVTNIVLGFSCCAPVILSKRFHPLVMAQTAHEHRGTFIIGAITAFIAMLNSPEVTAHHFQSLSKIYTGGAPVPLSVTRQFEEKFGHPIRSTYGLTESTALALSVPRNLNTPADEQGVLAVGVPVYDTDAYIADDDGEPLPAGEVGEIMLKGPQIVPGYWNKPEASCDAFKNGYLRTGDVGYMNEQGWFFIVDRKKDMINASGYKVWPREVEEVLYGHPAVREAAVVGVPDQYRGETVKAVVSLRPGQAVTEDELVAYCKERLAAYKYPRIVQILDELPKTATGKILRRELR